MAFFFTARKKILEFLVLGFKKEQILIKLWLIGNRTSCRPIRPLRGRLILLITRMITDQIRLHSVLLPLLIIMNMIMMEIMITISKGDRNEWRPVRSVIIRVINKIGRPRSGSPICLITSKITDWIGRHGVLLPINHNFNKICDM